MKVLLQMDNKKRIVFITILVTFIALSGYAQESDNAKTSELSDSAAWNLKLNEITVKPQQQIIKQESDRICYNVYADNEYKTQTVMDILHKVPLVIIDGEDNILVRGNKNFKIYKNGHLDHNLSKNAKEIFKTMPATAIKRIEIITDPGAREDAEGINAILNIVMMDTKHMKGFTGSLNTSYNWALKSPSLGAYLAAQLGKAIFSMDYGYNYLSKKATTNDGFINRTYVNTGNQQIIHSHGVNPAQIHYADINASIDIDKHNMLSASIGGYFYKVDLLSGSSVLMLSPTNDKLYSYNEVNSLPSYNHHTWNGRIDYEHKMSRDGERITLSYMLALTRQNAERETNYTKTQNFPYDYSGFLQDSREGFSEHSFQFDYVRPLWDYHKLEVGIKYINRRNESEDSQKFYDSIISTMNNSFDHTMRIVGLYANYIWERNNWSAQAGLRYEYSYMKSHYPKDMSKDFYKHLNDWVPHANLRYLFDRHNSLRLSFSTSIHRPGITYLNPTIYHFPDAIEFGNANLRSVRNQTIGISYMFTGRFFTFQIWPQFMFANNAFGQIIYANDDTRYKTYGNVLRQRKWQIESYVQWKPFDKTSFVVNLNFSHNNYRNSMQALEQNCNALLYYVNISQKLPWKIQATAFFSGMIGHSSMNIYSYAESYNRYTFSLQRSFLHNECLTVRFIATSPFHKNQLYKTRITKGDILGETNYLYTQNGRSFQISISFRFGSLKNRVKKTQITIENTDIEGGITRRK